MSAADKLASAIQMHYHVVLSLTQWRSHAAAAAVLTAAVPQLLGRGLRWSQQINFKPD